MLMDRSGGLETPDGGVWVRLERRQRKANEVKYSE